MVPHPLTNFEIQKYYQNEPEFNGALIKHEAYVTYLGEFKSIGTDWLALYVNGNNIMYFDSFGVENISKEIRKFIANKIVIEYKHMIQ